MMQVLCLQHIRDGLEVLHLKNLEVSRILSWPALLMKKNKIPDEWSFPVFED